MDSLRVIIFLVFTFLSIALNAQSQSVHALKSPDQVSMLSCSDVSQESTGYGFVVEKRCDGHKVFGIGTSLADANANAVTFGQLASSGFVCELETEDSDSIDVFPGLGYFVGYYCRGISYASEIDAVGTSLTDAGKVASDLAEIAAETGVVCEADGGDSDAIQVRDGGGAFYLHYRCEGPDIDGDIIHRDIGGAGTTFTGVGEVAVEFAAIAGTTHFYCKLPSENVDDIEIFLGGWRVPYRCDDAHSHVDTVDGVGSFVTDAGKNAAGFAVILANTGIECNVYDIIFGSGDSEVTFRCPPDFTGAGSTITSAAENALALAEAELL